MRKRLGRNNGVEHAGGGRHQLVRHYMIKEKVKKLHDEGITRIKEPHNQGVACRWRPPSACASLHDQGKGPEMGKKSKEIWWESGPVCVCVCVCVFVCVCVSVCVCV